MIVCHVCGTENADSNKYCEGCGVELQAAASAASATPVANPEATPTAAPEVPTPVVPAAVVEAVPAASDVVPTVGTTVQGDKTIEEILAEHPAENPNATSISAPASAPVETPELAPLPEAAAVATPEAAPAATPAETPAAVATPAATTGHPVNARLIPRQFGALTNAQFPLNGDRLTVGRFDPSTGPVDIDLTGLPGDSHVSRRHGEMFMEAGKWMVRDLGSTNGIYVKRAGEDKFGPRLQAPAPVMSGDEIAFGNVMFVYRDGPEA
jgi:FHA domain